MGTVAEKALSDKRTKLGASWAIFNPVLKTMVRWTRNRTRESEQPYFPGYMFVGVDHEIDDWRPINFVRGIKDNGIMLVGEEKPAVVRPLVMEDLLGRCDTVMVEQPDGSYITRHFIKVEEADRYLFRVGSKVKITEGPFAAFEGPVRWSSKDRVKVMLSIFGRGTLVEAEPKHLELVKV